VTQAVVRDIFEKASMNIINIEHCAVSWRVSYCQLLQLWIPWILSHGSSASLVETEETPLNAEGMLTPQKQQMKEIFKWGTPPISCVADI